MPLYTFRDINTCEQFDEMMSMSAREQYLKDNPNITQEIVKLNMVSGVGGIKNDAGWKENLSRWHSNRFYQCSNDRERDCNSNPSRW